MLFCEAFIMGCTLRNNDNRLIERSVFHGPFSSNNVTQATKLLLQLRENLHISQQQIECENIDVEQKIRQILIPKKLSDEEHDSYLKNLNPKEWRKQDHYAVLGLECVRIEATENDIRKAYRKIVLRHHPDKRPGRPSGGKNVPVDMNSDYFTCITKAWEILGNKCSRRSYDSVDPYVDDSLPSRTVYDADEFYDVFRRYFKNNERWSEITSVPSLGDENTSKEDVEKFYNFWFNFRSWRDYSYEFEDNDLGNLEKYERKWMEKQNKANRIKMKKEEMARIRKLVELAYNNDPRIKKFKQEEKEKKIAAKKAREEEIKASKLEAARLAKEAEERERRCREEEESAKRKEQETIKAEQMQIKKSLKRVKKSIRDICKQNNYYADNEKDIVKYMSGLEEILEMLSTLDELNVFLCHLQQEGRVAFVGKMDEVKRKIKEERLNSLNDVARGKNTSSDGVAAVSKTPWSSEELQLLVKAVSLFPAGTNNRWDMIANFLSRHKANRTAAEVLNKVKELQKVKQNPSCSGEHGDIIEVINSTRTWTNAEQQLLEFGLKTYSSSLNDRWEKIAKCIPNRTKEEVIQRYKDLVEAVKAKRSVQNSSAS